MPGRLIPSFLRSRDDQTFGACGPSSILSVCGPAAGGPALQLRTAPVDPLGPIHACVSSSHRIRANRDRIASCGRSGPLART